MPSSVAPPFDDVESVNRFSTPMKRVGKELVETSWDDALKLVSDALKKGGKDSPCSSGEAVGIRSLYDACVLFQLILECFKLLRDGIASDPDSKDLFLFESQILILHEVQLFQNYECADDEDDGNRELKYNETGPKD